MVSKSRSFDGHLWVLKVCLFFLFSASAWGHGPIGGSITMDSGRIVSFLQYLPEKGLKDVRGVIIMPPTGGISLLERSYAKMLCKKGARVVILDRWSGDDMMSLELNIHQRLFRRMLESLEVVMNMFPKNQKLTLFGTSVGGLAAASAASLFDRFDRVMVIAAGGPFTEIIVDSQQKDLKRLRKERYGKLGFHDRDSYLAALEPHFDLGPFQLPQGFKDKSLGMVILGKDRSVPTANQEKLFELWKPVFFRRLARTHIRGIIETRLRFGEDVVNFVFPEAYGL